MSFAGARKQALLRECTDRTRTEITAAANAGATFLASYRAVSCMLQGRRHSEHESRKTSARLGRGTRNEREISMLLAITVLATVGIRVDGRWLANQFGLLARVGFPDREPRVLRKEVRTP